MVSNSVCMEEGPRGFSTGFEGAGSPQGRLKGAADQNLEKPLEDRPTLAGHVVEFRMLCRMLGVLGLESAALDMVRSIRPKAFEEMGLGFCRDGRRPPCRCLTSDVEVLVFWGFGFLMHQTLLDTKSWLFLKFGTLSLLNSSQKKIKKIKKLKKLKKNF